MVQVSIHVESKRPANHLAPPEQEVRIVLKECQITTHDTIGYNDSGHTGVYTNSWTHRDSAHAGL